MATSHGDAKLRVWCNQILPTPARASLERGLAGHQLAFAANSSRLNLDTSPPDAVLRSSDIAFGQPDPRDIIESERLTWIHLSTAGYTKYDRQDVRDALRARGAVMTNSSSVYAEPCAQHLLAMMLGLARQMPRATLDQHPQKWNSLELRARSHLLGQGSVLFVGFGAIGKRLVELLTTFGMKITAVRRTPVAEDPVPTFAMEQTSDLLPDADHVVNILPAGDNTRHFFDEPLFGRMKRDAIFYNVGRGTTVDQAALAAALNSGKLSAAYLDVTDPEPLPRGHFLWTTANCHITPHSAGGHSDEYERLVAHFLENLERLESNRALRDQIL